MGSPLELRTFVSIKDYRYCHLFGMSFPRRRESRTQEQTGFLLEFIPMEIGAGMTKKIAPKAPPLSAEVPDEA